MGRESRFLLTLLGLLAGFFVAALSIRLFSPRPPKGTGPDIHTSAALTAPTPLVPPPVLTPRPRSEPLPSLGPEPPADTGVQRLAPADLPTLAAPAAMSRSTSDSVSSPSRFSSSLISTTLVSNDEPVTAASPPWKAADQSVTGLTQTAAAARLQPPASEPLQPQTEATTAPAFRPPPAKAAPPSGPPPVTPGQPYVVVADDCWWSIAERAYGDGRYYRSLFAWNRAITPSISLTTGTTLEIPPLARLELAWPRLMPAD